MEKIGRFEITGKLGRGAFGMVYKGHDPVINRDAAIKVMSEATVGDPELVQRFKREAEACGGLNHPNIVTIYDLGEHDGLPYIAMEFLEGADLELTLKNKVEMTYEEKIKIIEQVADGLHYAHGMGIIHRDIKPANIRLLDDQTVKIMDFGIAKMASSDMTRTGQFMGTVNYMSPEQIKAKKLDGRSDLFALGILFYELLTFRRPFPGDSITAVIFKIVNENPPPLKELHGTPFEWLESVVLKCLAKDVNQRWASCKEFADAMRSKVKVAVAAAPSALDATMAVAQQTAVDGDIDAALAQIDRILEQDPDNQTVLKQKRNFVAMRTIRETESMISSGRLEQARDALLKATEIDDKSEELKRTLVEVQDKITAQRVKSLREQAKRNLDEKRFEAAIDLLKEAAELDPYNEELKSALDEATHNRRGADVGELVADAQVLLDGGQFAEAKAQAQKALAIDPQSRKARSLLQSSEREHQKRQTSSAVEESLFNANENLKNEEYDGAISLAEEAVRLDPANVEAKKFLKSAKASKVAASDRSAISQHLTAGRKLLKQKKFSEARVAFNRVLKLDSHNDAGKFGVIAAQKKLATVEAAQRKIQPAVLAAIVAVALVVVIGIGWVVTRPSDALLSIQAGDAAVATGTVEGLNDAFLAYSAALELPGKDREYSDAKDKFSKLSDGYSSFAQPLDAIRVLDQVVLWDGVTTSVATRYLALADDLQTRGLNEGRTDLLIGSGNAYRGFFAAAYDASNNQHWDAMNGLKRVGTKLLEIGRSDSTAIDERVEALGHGQGILSFIDQKDNSFNTYEEAAAAGIERHQLAEVNDKVSLLTGSAKTLLDRAQKEQLSSGTRAKALGSYKELLSLVARNDELEKYIPAEMERFRERARSGSAVVQAKIDSEAAQAGVQTLLTGARDFEEQKDLVSARGQYERVLALESGHPRATARIAEIAVLLDRLVELRSLSQRAVDRGDLGDAATLLEEALAIDPNDTKLGSLQSVLEERQKRAVEGDRVASMFAAAKASSAGGKLDEAEKQLKEILNSTTDDTISKRAIKAIGEVRLKKIEAEVRPKIIAAESLEKSGKLAEALKGWQEINRIHNDYPGARQAMSRLSRAINSVKIEALEKQLRTAFAGYNGNPNSYQAVKRELLAVDGQSRLVAQFDKQIQDAKDQVARATAQAAEGKRLQMANEQKVRSAQGAVAKNDPDRALAELSGVPAQFPGVAAIRASAQRLQQSRAAGLKALNDAKAALQGKRKQETLAAASRAAELWPPLRAEAQQIVNAAASIKDPLGAAQQQAKAGKWASAAASLDEAIAAGLKVDKRLGGRVFFNASYLAACRQPCNLASARTFAAKAAQFDDSKSRPTPKVSNLRWNATVPGFKSCTDLNLKSLCKVVKLK